MTDPRAPAFAEVLKVPGIPRDLWSDPGNILAFDSLLDAWGADREVAPGPTVTALTPRIVNYLAGEEWLVTEAYKDSEGVWTWALGVTNASGHQVYPRYKDNPQSLERCLEVSIWLMREKYLPPVLARFGDFALTEAQLAAALSWHWNTGAIGKTDWVRLVKERRMSEARAFMLSHYTNDGILSDRRKREADLFFDGVWPHKPPHVLPVAKPSYTPAWGKAQQVDLLPAIEKVMAT